MTRDIDPTPIDASNAIDPLDQSPLARWVEAEGGFNIIVDERWGAFFPKDSEEQVKLLVESVNRVFNESR